MMRERPGKWEGQRADRLQMSCEHVGLELRPKTSETVSSAYKWGKTVPNGGVQHENRRAAFVTVNLTNTTSIATSRTEHTSSSVTMNECADQWTHLLKPKTHLKVFFQKSLLKENFWMWHTHFSCESFPAQVTFARSFQMCQRLWNQSHGVFNRLTPTVVCCHKQKLKLQPVEAITASYPLFFSVTYLRLLCRWQTATADMTRKKKEKTKSKVKNIWHTTF